MHSTQNEREMRERFSHRYLQTRNELTDEIERRVLGGTWGGNGFTTVQQADLLADSLRLGPGDLLLDFGTGRGWPGVYLAKRTGCRVVLSDLPPEGLMIAKQRAEREKIDLLAATVASARDLPYAHESFDAVTHTDVLC